MGFMDMFSSLIGGGPNQIDGGDNNDTQQGIVSDLLPELKLDKSEEELLEMAKNWVTAYEPIRAKIKDKQDENERYWLGKHHDEVQYKVSGKKPPQENRIFADLESFLPIATRQAPEPLVNGGESSDGQRLADNTAKMLSYQADIQKLKLIIKKSTRFWALYYVGAVQFGWSTHKNDIVTKVIRPQNLIFEPGAVIDEQGYSGKYLGVYREAEASEVILQFPNKQKEIEKLVDKQKGTKIRFIEWWTDEFVFWTLKEKTLLGKMKNPHWNYEEEREVKDMFGNIVVDEESGDPKTTKYQLKNHFSHPSMPFRFMGGVFSLNDQVHENTNLIEQNIPLQDRLNERHKQIEKNVKDMNGGAVVSGDFFSKDEAQQVAVALKKGDAVWVPEGDVRQAFARQTGTPLPSDVYNNMLDLRQQMDNLFGIHGTTRGERSGPETLGGRILLKGSDVDRISFIADYIEQFVDDIFNYWVQMMHVYYDEEHVGSILGEERAQELVRLSRGDFNQSVVVDDEEQQKEVTVKLLVSVREGSLLPKDPVIRANQAIDLFKMGALDPITLYERLDFANPRDAAKKLYLWNTSPEMLFPELQKEIQQKEAERMAQEQAENGGAPPTAPMDMSQMGGTPPLPTELPIDLNSSPQTPDMSRMIGENSLAMV